VTIYTGFASFYDRIMGDRSEEVDRIRTYVSRHMPGAQSLLELGCGTGALLAGLTSDLDVTGIDQSPQMLAVAQATVPDAHLVRGDMTAFSLPGQFDVVICMFDTLNHVPSFDGWLSLFSCVHEHLVEGGLFIFDVNTAGRLRRLDGAPPFVDEFDGNVVIMTVRSAHDGLSLWETKIFDRQHDDI
jgi:SAM-dependent methyltransferase